MAIDVEAIGKRLENLRAYESSHCVDIQVRRDFHDHAPADVQALLAAYREQEAEIAKLTDGTPPPGPYLLRRDRDPFNGGIDIYIETDREDIPQEVIAWVTGQDEESWATARLFRDAPTLRARVKELEGELAAQGHKRGAALSRHGAQTVPTPPAPAEREADRGLSLEGIAPWRYCHGCREYWLNDELCHCEQALKKEEDDEDSG